jgi:glutathione S-transferase
VITLYGFKTIFPEGIGETKDLRAQWVLEECGLPYKVHGVDHVGGETETDAYTQLNPFRQVPVIDDDGFVITESAAIALYVAEKAGKLIPPDAQGRMRVTQWCFVAVSTIAPINQALDVVGIFDPENHALAGQVKSLAYRFLAGLERRLDGRQWIATDEFTVADLMMAGVLREMRKTDLMDSHPNVKRLYERCIARPAWEKTLRLYADRLGVTVAAIR